MRRCSRRVVATRVAAARSAARTRRRPSPGAPRVATAALGRSGSVVRTLIGVTVIAIIEVVLLLRGFSQQLQYLITGLIVLAVIMLHTIGERR